MDKIISDISRNILFFMTLIVITTSLFFVLGISICVWNVIIPFVIVLANIVLGKESVDYKVLVVLTSITTFIVFVLISASVYEFSVDGNAYHKQAIGLLKDGWNPLYYTSSNYNLLTHSSQLNDAGPLFWTEVYPKATWYFAACIYFITGNIEAGKCYTLLFAIITFGFCLDYFKKRIDNIVEVRIFSFVIAFNPIVCAQNQSYYLDGVVSAILSILILTLIDCIKKEKIDNKLYIGCLIVWGCNLKFSVVLFVVTYCLLYVIINSIATKKLAIRNALFLMENGLFSVFIVGCAPYLTNFKRYGNMFYGFFGLVDEAAMAQEFGVSSLSKTGRFIASIFGKMSGGTYTTLKDLLKVPFTIHDGELNMYYVTDSRVSGFGVLFSGLFIISVIMIMCEIVKNRKHIKEFMFSELGLGIIFFIVSFCEMMFIPQTSQVRYVPQLYLVVLLGLIVTHRNIKQIGYKCVYVIMCACILINILPWVKISLVRVNEGALTTATLINMGVESENGRVFDISYCNDTYNGLDYNLKDNNIKYNYIYAADIDETYEYTYSYMIRFK